MNKAVAAPGPELAPLGVQSAPKLPETEAGERAAHGWAPARGALQVEDCFDVLDDPLEQAEFTEFSQFEGQRRAESVLMVQGMHCAACADTVETLLGRLPGVVSAQVHAGARRLSLRWCPEQTTLSGVAQALGQAGYRLLPMGHASSVSERLGQTRGALWRLFVAGFCAMQVMMYAWPAYVSEPGDLPADLGQLLRWASWLLSLPVVFFASGPFFRSAWRDLKQARVGMDTPVALGIAVTFAASSAATFDPTGPWGHEVWFDSLTMFVFFLLGGRYLELKARDRTAGALDSLMNRLPQVCDRQRPDGSFEAVSARRLGLGDVVRVQAGQAFAGDGTLLSEAATVDEALLSGESYPLSRLRGQSVIAGSYNVGGPVLVRMDKLGRETRFAQIVDLMRQASVQKPRLALLADRVAAPFLVWVLLAAALAGWGWWWVEPSRALSVAVAVLIVTCPCALSIATPAAMLACAGMLARRGILVRRLQAFEALARVSAVVFDKTGTLTHDQLVLGGVRTRKGITRNQALALAAQLASGSLHPVSRALVAAAKQTHASAHGPALSKLSEIAGQGMQGVCPDGSVLRLGSANWCGVQTAPGEQIEDTEDAPAVWLSDAQGWLATFALQERLREDACETVAALRALGLRVWLLSGDRQAAAQRVGQAVGVDRVVAGAQPEQKLEQIAALQAQGHKVAMVGDGLNDGPVLARADTSFALGHAVPLAQAQSDYVIQSGQLMDVVRTLTQARLTLRIVRQNLIWAALYNLVCVPLALLGLMPPWLAGLGMASSSLLVLANALRLTGQPWDRGAHARFAEARASGASV